MDPITAATTIITLATFIKDLIDVGQSIKSSIDKVSENRRQIRDLTDDILRVLAEMGELSRQQAGQSQAPALLSALGDLKADMLYVLAACRKISPAQPSPGFRGFRSQIKVWMKRDDIEAKIRRLKERVNKCYLEFTAFSAARIEQTTTGIKETTHRTDNTTLRVEQSLIVNHVENQVKLQRLEGLMARMLLETQFGQDVISRTIEIMTTDVFHQIPEFKYLSTQTLRLVDLLQDSVATSTLVLDTPLWDGTSLVFIKPHSADHILCQILGVIVAIKESHASEIQLSSIKGIGDELALLGMNSEAIAWELMIVQILRHLPGNGFQPAPGILPNLAFSSNKLSRLYQYQLRWDLATETSQRAMDMCRLWQELSPDVEDWSLLGTVLITHSENLRMNGLLEAAISIAEEAVAVFRRMAAQLTEAAAEVSCWGEEEEYKAVRFSDAFFTHAAGLASADRHFAAYEAAREGFQTVLRFPRTDYPPPAKVIDTFIDQLCHVAEGGSLSLGMLADDMILFRDLARVYPKESPTLFLRLLHTYVYMSQQASPDFQNLRIFLEPDSASSAPVLDPSRELKVHDCIAVIKDVIRAYYFRPGIWPGGVSPLIENIFIAHFDHAVAAFREIALNSMHDQPLDRLPDDMGQLFRSLLIEIFPLVTRTQKLVLVEIMAEIVGHLRTVTTALSYQVVGMLWNFSGALWNTGLLNDAISLCDEVVEYLRCSPRDEDYSGLDPGLLRRTFILWDMGQISQVIEAAHLLVIEETTSSLNRLNYYMIRKQILQRTGRNWEAVKLLREACGEVVRLRVDNYYAHIPLADLAAAQRLTGQLGKAVENAERVVAVCREDVGDTKVQKHGLVHSLTILSNCLAGVGRNDEALVAAEEAASTYSLHAPRMQSCLYTYRGEELGANVFHALSLRLVASGQLEAALLNAERATELYRESVSLAPLHLPTLASSLQNLASILWNISRRDESISASDEAVSIMRKVADCETYLLGALGEALDQLAGYLAEKGDAEGAAAATSESAEVQRRIELLPPEPEFLFSAIETESEDEDDNQARETATESKEYHDAAIDVEVASLDAAHTISSQDLPSTPQISSSTETQSEENTVSQAPAIVFMEQTTMSPVASQSDNHVSQDTVKPATPPPRVADILSTPLEVKLYLQLRSTPLDIIWWILLGVLGVALAAVWSHR